MSVAAVNGPRSVVVSGEAQTRRGSGLLAGKEQGRKTKRLRVSHAFHSALMDPMLEEFQAVAEGVVYSVPRIGVVSNVTGGVAGDELAAPGYWVRHVREAVRFADGVGALEAAGVRRFIELGPDGVLCGMVDECVSEGLSRGTLPSGESPRFGQREGVLLAPALRAGRDEVRTVLEFFARVDCDGLDVDWQALFAGGLRVGWRSRRMRFSVSATGLRWPGGWGMPAVSGLGVAEHPLLGAAVRVAGERDGWLFTGRLSLDSHGWIGDHAVFDTVLLPGTGFVELVLAAGREVGCEV